MSYHTIDFFADEQKISYVESECLELLISRALERGFKAAFSIGTTTKGRTENAIKRASFALERLGYSLSQVEIDCDIIKFYTAGVIKNVFDIQAILWFTREKFRIPLKTTEFADYATSKALDSYYKNTLIYLYFRSKGYVFENDINAFFGVVANGPVTLVNYFVFEGLIPNWMLEEFDYRSSKYSR